MERPPPDVRAWSQPMVLDWLHQLELEQYAPQFQGTSPPSPQENDIDGEALVLLDDASLRDLGIASIGHRMTLLSEIFRLKESHGIPIEPGDWVPQNYETLDAPEWFDALRERGRYACTHPDDRISALELRVAQLSTSLLRLREDVVGLARATDKPDAVQTTLIDTPHGPPMRRTPTSSSPFVVSPKLPSLASNDGTPSSRQSVRGRMGTDGTPRRLDSAEKPPISPLRDVSTVPHVGSLAPVSDAVAQMLQASGADVPVVPGDERVTVDDTTRTLLALALYKYGVHEDWREYVLFVHYASTERCLTYEEKPLLILHKLRESGHQPWFIVRPLREVESPVVLAERKLQLRRRDAGRQTKNEAMRLRAPQLDLDEETAEDRVFSVSQWVSHPDLSASQSELLLQEAQVMGPVAGLQQLPPHAQTYALAIYPYESEREDEFDVRAGDAFIVLAKAKGWWALRRDSLADGQGDVFIPKDWGDTPHIEIWTGWVPAGCLLETSRPIADLLFAQAGGTVSPTHDEERSYSPPHTSTHKTLRHELIHAPLPLAIVLSSGSHGTMLTDFVSPDDQLHLPAHERLRVFKRYHHWSYCIVDGPSQARGWVPSCYISRKSISQEQRTLSAGEMQSRRSAGSARLY